MDDPRQIDAETRARVTRGTSGEPIYRMVTAELADRVQGRVGTLYDIGCGTGRLVHHVADRCDRYVGMDLVRYDDFPADREFVGASLDAAPYPLPDASGDVVVSVETIEHLENPRLHVRELTRLTKPGGLVIVTTPNNLTWLSLLTLLRRGVFNAFQEGPGLYPAHRTALVETDLRRIATECGLEGIRVRFSDDGRVPGMSRHWPGVFRGRRFSDNVLIGARRPR